MGGGKSNEEETSQQFQEPMYYYPQMPSFNPYQELLGGTGLDSAQQLLAGAGNVPQVNSPGFVPTSGWAGTGNADMIPGAAYQLLRMAQSPMYLW